MKEHQTTLMVVAGVSIIAAVYLLTRRKKGAPLQPAEGTSKEDAVQAAAQEPIKTAGTTSVMQAVLGVPSDHPAGTASEVLNGVLKEKNETSPKKKKDSKKKKEVDKPKAAVSKPKAPTATQPTAPEAEVPLTPADHFVNAIVQRSILTQPVDLLEAAAPAKSKEKSKEKSKDKKKKVMSSWGESFLSAMQALESNTPDAIGNSQELLNTSLLAAGKPGSPKDAMTITLRGLGYLNASIAQLTQSQSWYERALKEAQKKPNSMVLLGCWKDLAVLAREMKDYKLAEERWESAIGLGKAMLKDKMLTDAEFMELRLCIADSLRDQERYDECKAIVQEVLTWREKNLGPQEPATGAAKYDMARVLRCAATPPTTPDEAAKEYDDGWQTQLKGLCESEIKYADRLVMLASVAQLHKNFAEAAQLFETALPQYESTHGTNSLEVAELLNNMGECIMECAQYPEASQCFDRAFSLVKEANGDQDPSLASIMANQAKLSSVKGDTAEAEERFDKAVALMQVGIQNMELQKDDNSLVVCQVLYARVLKLYAEHHKQCGKTDEADAMWKQIKALEKKYGFLVQ